MTIQRSFLKKEASGFSAIEILIVLAIAGILLAITIPNLYGWLEKNRLTGVARKIVNDLHFCRQQAISEDRYYVMDFESTTPIAYTIKYGPAPGMYTDLRRERLEDSGGFISFVASGDPVFNDRGGASSQVTLTITSSNNEIKTIIVSAGGKISSS